MNRSELASMTVLELKALARKKKIALPAGAKKADIIKVLAKALGAQSKKTSKAAVTRTRRKTAVKPKSAASATKRGTTARKAPVKKTPATRKAPAAGAAEKTVPQREGQIPAGVKGPLAAQELVSDAKYFTGTPEPGSALSHGMLPHEYGEERMALLARDPYIAYGYWELPQSRLEQEKRLFGWDSRLCVRVYDVTGVQWDGTNATAYFDQDVDDRIGAWYFDLGRPAHSFCADLGLRAPDGRFLTILRSNVITLARDGVSDVIDEEWTLPDEEFTKLYGVPGQPVGGPSSLQVREVMRQRRMMEITSPGMFAKRKTKKK